MRHEYNDGYLVGHLDDDELWSSVDPEYQVRLLADTREDVLRRLILMKERMNYAKLTNAERNELKRKRVSTELYRLRLDARTTKAKVELRAFNLKRSNTEAGRRAAALYNAVKAHKEVTDQTTSETPEHILLAADDALYQVLEDIEAGKYNA